MSMVACREKRKQQQKLKTNKQQQGQERVKINKRGLPLMLTTHYSNCGPERRISNFPRQSWPIHHYYCFTEKSTILHILRL